MTHTNPRRPNKLIAVALFAFSHISICNAALINRGGGLIYDTDLNVTWLQDVNYASTLGLGTQNGRMNYQSALSFADQLVFGGGNNWRLPTTPVLDASCNEDFIPSYDTGSNCSGSEIGHLYYIELGNLAHEDADGNPQSGFGMVNEGPFLNFPDGVDRYWTSTLLPGTTDTAFSFDIHNGLTEIGPLTNLYHVWLVHDGDIAAVPVPAAIWLFISGLFTIGLLSKRRQLGELR